ncbi:MAG: AmmeMemoRadiSam system radical SAM enzyme [Candidatus Aceula lacicola]|nr:AmmeMemoRadiSam system radical SAM enzyme [Candidatus Aceula lacicola]
MKILNLIKKAQKNNQVKFYIQLVGIAGLIFIILLFGWKKGGVRDIGEEKKITLDSKADLKEKGPLVNLKEALYWINLDDERIQCQLCPRRCILKDGQKGLCQARKNIKGKMYALTYGQPVALHVDPIEKKPLNHVYPGTKSFSLATAGCNLRCKFCQNWEISRLDAEKVDVEFVSPKKVVEMAKQSSSKTIAFTYTEPTIFFEYMLDIAKEAKKQNIDCVMHSAGFIQEKPLREIAKYIKAANIDLKGFSDEFYSTFIQGDLAVVLNTLKILKEEGVWLEITNLIIPGGNDSDEEILQLCQWIKDNLGKNTPIHFGRFFPMYKLTNLSPTPLSSLLRAYDIAKKVGLNFVYIGNIPQQIGEDTRCPRCGKMLIKRRGYTILENNLKEGKCPFCGEKIAGIWR